MTSTVQKQNSRSRAVARGFLVGVEVFVAVGAVYGGVGLIADNSIGMLPEWLDGTPFSSWTLPGIFLLMIVAAPMFVAAVAELRRVRWAYAASLVAGAAMVGWIVVQLLVIGRYFFLQPIMFACGAAVIVLAWAVHHGERVLPTR
ncbi:hypothetical protein ACVBEQ_27670 [Nakamurella sp. GG22]